jgi:NAD(P)-dependent dehydrogenase (short-subunit alcohol dehydrogenase family)
MNQVALITGASRGIGRGIAIELAQLGWDLVINYATNRSAADQTATECAAVAGQAGKSIRAEICQADIAAHADRRKLIDFTRRTFSRLDLLVNNAGIAPQKREDILNASEESFDALVKTNLKGPYFLTQHAAHWLIEQCHPMADPQSSPPQIIFISSVSAYAASVNRGDYCITKAALSMVTALFAARLADYGINVYEIRPGIIGTDMTQPVKEKYDKLIGAGLTPIKRWGKPEDVGKAVAAIAQRLFPFSTGEVINADGGFHLRIL